MLLDFFGLREQPFCVSPHPSYLYSSRSRSEALDSLTHAAASSGTVLALLGVSGVGKTTLLNQFLANLPSSTRPILLPNTPFSASELHDFLLRELGASAPGMASLSESRELSELISAEMHAGSGYVVVADDAEKLDASALETACGLADCGAAFSVILTGKPGLHNKLQSNPSPLSFATKLLEPLSGPETAAYIQHRLRVAGHPAADLFERESLALIAERGRGIPRNINQICFRALLEGYASGCRTLSPDIVEKAAQKLELGGAGQPVPKLRASQPILSAKPHSMPQGRPQPRKRVFSPVLLRQLPLRRAAVAALAATTLALPYLAAKRISESIRPGTSATTLAPQVSRPAESKGPSDVSPLATAVGSKEPTGKPPSPTEPAPIARSRQQVTLASHSSSRETTERIRASDSPERIPTDGPRFSLARELGLKINRIAIDAGHGGYDTGTIGPSGLMEKDLCLDVALRLGRMIKENIPGAEVIYTRTDDRYIPLEERTSIANEGQADLLISIHANSSDVGQIRGVETYYVSLATSPEAREIATRENAVGDSSLHNLPDLIKKITRNENLAESQQLAADLQSSLSRRLQLVSRQETNRGVKRAPFIVLTGANMPAVLSEISFLSNPTDDKLLLENDQRQRITEGLYRGIADYLGTMPTRAIPEHTRTRSASVGALSSTQTDGLR
jgi:N-acetylmuramoyl-L-alanine amidase